MTVHCCPLCRGCGLHPQDGDVEDVQQMRNCPACEGRGSLCQESRQEYPRHVELFIAGHLRRHATSQ